VDRGTLLGILLTCNPKDETSAHAQFVRGQGVWITADATGVFTAQTIAHHPARARSVGPDGGKLKPMCNPCGRAAFDTASYLTRTAFRNALKSAIDFKEIAAVSLFHKGTPWLTFWKAHYNPDIAVPLLDISARFVANAHSAFGPTCQRSRDPELARMLATGQAGEAVEALMARRPDPALYAKYIGIFTHEVERWNPPPGYVAQ
jgi:hypothetical protein